MIPFYQLSPVKFSCTGCGKCCTGGSEYHVFLSEAEARAIQASLGITWAWFRRRYLAKHVSANSLVIRADKNQARCVFLLNDNSCKVYSVRPLQCRTYPYWPEIMATRAAWKNEAARCEGIGRGESIDADKISRILRQVEQHDEKTK